MDQNSALPVRSEELGSLSTRISDATVPSQQLVVEADGSINVNASAIDLDIRDLSAAQDNVAISDGTDTLAINNDGSINSVVSATDLDIRDLVFATDKVDVSGSSVTVSSTDLDIRDLDATQDNVAISDGTNTLAIAADGSIKVVVQEDVGTEVVNFDTTAAVAGGASDNHDFVVTNGGKLFQVLATGSGKLKAEVQIETGSATGVFNTVTVAFNSTATPNMELMLAKYATIPVGARVRVIRTNRENQAQDVYSTIILIANL